MKQPSPLFIPVLVLVYVVLAVQASSQTPPPILTGSEGDRLGLSMANAGDVNGDGIDDLIVGADHYFGNKVGEVRIYFGGHPSDFNADVVFTGDSLLDFGWSASGAGDVNGDGYDDVLVSALGTAAYLYFGGDPMDTTPDVVIPAVPTVNMFGLKVAAAGDVNGDGYDDFVVCAPPPAERGIFLYFGSPAPATTPGLTFEGFSRAESAGDMNKDGYDDLIIGNPALPPNPSWAALHFGGPAMDTIPDLIYRTGLGDSFGSSLAGNGDLNGDGWLDLVICAAGDSSGGTAAGRAYVFFGDSVLDTIPDFTYTGSGTYNLVGYKETAILGDIDFDGYDDFCVSSDVYIDPFSGKRGMVHIFRGGPDISEDTTLVGEDDRGNFGWSVAPIDFDGDDDIEVFIGAFYAPYQLKSGKVYRYDPPLDWRVLTGSPGDRVGLSVAGAGDVNNDGYPDIIIGADHYYGDKTGEARIYFGGNPPDFAADVVLSGVGGWAVAGAGDVNGDLYDDVLVKADGDTVYLYFGGAPMDNIPDVVFPSPPGVVFFGFSVARAGDVNNDGYDDIVICGQGRQGAFVYYGGPLMSVIPALVLAGGTSAACAGDMNKDGYDDIVVGRYNYLYFGGASMDTIPDLTLIGEPGDDVRGRSVAGGSDINGDGWLDIVLGSPLTAAGGTDAGRAYVYFGGAVLDGNPDYIVTGTGPGNRLGWNVASFGDLDEDGYGDFSISSDVDLFPDAGTNGKVHFFRGGPSIIPDTTLVGEAEQDNFGWSVSSVGDFDGDSVQDVIIGASYAVFGEKRGKVYLSQRASPVVPVPEVAQPVPDKFALLQNYPNPFNPSTTIKFDLPFREYVTLKIYDLLGREVATLINEPLEPGVHSVNFSAQSLSSGVYFYRIEAGTIVQTKKMVLLK